MKKNHVTKQNKTNKTKQNKRERNQNTSNNLKEKSFNGSSDEIKDAKAEDKPATS